MLALCAAALMSGGVVHAAASLVISPVRITLTEGNPVAILNVRNQGSERVTVQLQLLSWTQENGEDVHVLDESFDLVACPPIFTIESGADQVVRVGLFERPKEWIVERAYRLFVQEVPSALEGEISQIQIAVRISLPVFLKPTKPEKPELIWHIEDRGADGLWMNVNNKGNMHALVRGVKIQHDATFTYETGTHQYVLPGSTMSWRLDATNPVTGAIPENVQLTVSTDQGVYEETLSVDK